MAKKSRIQEIPADIVEASGAHVEDAKTLRPMELQKLYKSTYSPWNNMRYGKDRAEVDPRWERFADFLIDVGPRPGEEYSIDRIDPSGIYAPGNVRWATKQEQANNRGVTVRLTHNGITKPLSEWARETRQKPDTLRNRRDNGWSDSEIVTGQRGGPPLYDFRPWDHHEDAEQREAAERFYLGNKLSGEAPIRFSLRKFCEGLAPWDDFLDDLGFFHRGEDDPTSGIAGHCIPQLDRAQNMLRRLSPAKLWLEQICAGLGGTAEKATSAKGGRRRSRPAQQSRRRDHEVEYLNHCESNPGLAYTDEDAPW